MRPSQDYAEDVTIKSRYLATQQDRTIVVSFNKAQISISQLGRPSTFKEFHIDELQHHHVHGNQVLISFHNGRQYEVQSSQPQRLNKALTHARNLQLSHQFVDQPIRSAPHPVNYTSAMNSMFNLVLGSQAAGSSPRQQFVRAVDVQQPSGGRGLDEHGRMVVERGECSILVKQRPIKIVRVYSCLPFFKNPGDWKINEKGNMVIMNEVWKSNAGKIVGFLIKKFITTGNFMGLSFPVFAMQPESILQTYAKSIAAAPKIITRSLDPIRRMKEFSCLIWTISLLHVTLLKPFNPFIGETFQADIDGGQYSAEQVSHHPPVSAFHYRKDNYCLSGALELSASIGLNSGEGRFLGDITIVYDDGHWIKGRLPSGEITGIIFGQTTFRAYGGAYVYDSHNMVLSYELGSDSTFQGYMGILNFRSSKHFKQEVLTTVDRYSKFKAYPKEEYSRILHKFTARYASWMAYDSKEVYNFANPALFPFELHPPLEGEHLLRSDSRLRRDTALLNEGAVERSQEEKEVIEEGERTNRKLREKYA